MQKLYEKNENQSINFIIGSNEDRLKDYKNKYGDGLREQIEYSKQKKQWDKEVKNI